MEEQAFPFTRMDFTFDENETSALYPNFIQVTHNGSVIHIPAPIRPKTLSGQASHFFSKLKSTPLLGKRVVDNAYLNESLTELHVYILLLGDDTDKAKKYFVGSDKIEFHFITYDELAKFIFPGPIYAVRFQKTHKNPFLILTHHDHKLYGHCSISLYDFKGKPSLDCVVRNNELVLTDTAGILKPIPMEFAKDHSVLDFSQSTRNYQDLLIEDLASDVQPPDFLTNNSNEKKDKGESGVDEMGSITLVSLFSSSSSSEETHLYKDPTHKVSLCILGNNNNKALEKPLSTLKHFNMSFLREKELSNCDDSTPLILVYYLVLPLHSRIDFGIRDVVDKLSKHHSHVARCVIGIQRESKSRYSRNFAIDDAKNALDTNQSLILTEKPFDLCEEDDPRLISQESLAEIERFFHQLLADLKEPLLHKGY